VIKNGMSAQRLVEWQPSLDVSVHSSQQRFEYGVSFPALQDVECLEQRNSRMDQGGKLSREGRKSSHWNACAEALAHPNGDRILALDFGRANALGMEL
jgi:hypothetical protein